MTELLDFAAVLDLLGHDDHVALCTKRADGPFITTVGTPATIAPTVPGLVDVDAWFSVNAIAGPAGSRPRGPADAVTRLCALYADLDVKAGACTSLEQAHAIVDDLAEILGARPTIVIASGHGLQPLWPIDDGQIGSPDDRARAAVTLKRFGRLVATVGARRDAGVDSVFDLPRILRVPGTVNHKGDPVPVLAHPDTGAPLSLDEIDERLDEWGVPALESDQYLAEPLDTSTYTWAEQTCRYAKTMIASWASENPDARHPWLTAQATRIAAARRHGCLTAADHTRAVDALTTRMQELCGAGSNSRAVAPSEVRDALAWGEARIAGLADGHIARELGNHDHRPDLTLISGGDNIAGLAGTTTRGTAALAPAQQPIATTLTDYGNSQQLVHQHGHELRYNPDRGAWLSWDGARWRPDVDNAIAVRMGLATAKTYPEETKEQAAHKRKTLSRAGIDNMLALARTDPIIRATSDELDADPALLNTTDGTVDLRTGQIRPHSPRDNITKVTGAGYSPDVPTPRWDAFLRDTFGGDATLIAFVRRICGTAATGDVRHHILPFLFGGGQNGKSVLTDVLLSVLGEYAISLPSSVLIASRYRHDTEIADLAGARLAICSEVTQDGKFDEERVKMLTGGDRLVARYLYGNPFQFRPSHTLMLHGNHQPAVEAGGKSFWRRLRLIPFENTVPDEKRIEGLADILVAEEGAGILAWIVQGAIEQYAHGLGEPDSVMAATKAYEGEEDHFGQFVSDCLHLAPDNPQGVKTDTAQVRKAYESWCRDNGRSAISAQQFGREIKRRTGATVIRSNGSRFYGGLGLVTGATEPDWRDR